MHTHGFWHVPHHRHAALAAGLALATTLAALVVLLLSATGAAAADAYRVWERQYAGSAGSDTWQHIAKGPSGTVYVAGWRNAEAATQRLMVAKYSPGGRRVWLRTFAGRAGAWVHGLAVDARGRAYVLGGEYYPGSSVSHICLLKLASTTGKRVWLKRYDGPSTSGGDYAANLALGPQGAVYVAGTTTGAGDDRNALLLRFTDKGGSATRDWVRTYRDPSAPDGDDDDSGRRVVVDANGRVYWGGTVAGADGHDRAFVRRVSPATGGPLWTRVPSTTWVDEIQLADLARRPGGGVVLAAATRDAAAAGGVFFAQFGPGGAPGPGALIDSADSEVPTDLAVSASGRMAVAGYLADDATHVPSAWVLSMEPGAGGWWQQTFDSPQAGAPAAFQSLAFGAGDALYCGGRARSGFITGQDFTLVKYSAAGGEVWASAYDDLDANLADGCEAVLYVGGSRPGVYGAGRGGATPLGEALLIKYVR